jgi:calcineurin-like phosphoesterase family protein
MDEQLIANWNSKITNNDIVFHLGDAFLSNAALIKDVLHRLNGKQINIIWGNHCNGFKQFCKGISNYPELNNKIKVLGDYAEINVNNQEIVLCHFPMLIWNKKHYGSWMISSHSHYNLPATRKEANCIGKIVDCGVDGNNYFPYSFDEIKQIMDNKDLSPKLDVFKDHHM